MSSGKVVGELTYSSTKGEFKWEIPIPNSINSATFRHGNLESPSFYILNAEWCLRITDKVINGIRWGIGLYLVAQNPSSEYMITFTFSIGHLNGIYKFGPETRFFDKTCTSHGKEKFVTLSDLQTEHRNLKVSSLVVDCHVVGTPLQSTACQTSLSNRSTTMCRNFQDLLLSGRRSDVAIQVRGQKFKAHKVILEARSPVFAAMFEHDFTEKKEDIIKIEDCDPDTFQIFLKCVYAGRVEDSTLDKAIRLYMIAHKYTVTDIMENCVQLMKVYLSEETCCDILALANRYNETELKNFAEEYIAQNSNKIFSTNNWSSFVAAGENSALQKYS